MSTRLCDFRLLVKNRLLRNGQTRQLLLQRRVYHNGFVGRKMFQRRSCKLDQTAVKPVVDCTRGIPLIFTRLRRVNLRRYHIAACVQHPRRQRKKILSFQTRFSGTHLKRQLSEEGDLILKAQNKLADGIKLSYAKKMGDIRHNMFSRYCDNWRQECSKIVMEAEKNGKASIELYNEVIAIACGRKDFQMARKYISKVAAKNYILSHETLGPYLQLCASFDSDENRKAWMKVLNRIYYGNYKLETIDNRLFSGMLREIAENGRTADVDRVINSFMRSKFGIEPNDDTYNEILLGYVARGDMFQANKVLQNMILKENLAPTPLTYKALIHGYTFNNDVIAAYKCLDDLLALDGKIGHDHSNFGTDGRKVKGKSLDLGLVVSFLEMHINQNDIGGLRSAMNFFEVSALPKNNFLVQSTLAKCYQVLGNEYEMLQALKKAKLGTFKKLAGKRNIEAVHLFLNLAMQNNLGILDDTVELSGRNTSYAASIHQLLYKLGLNSSELETSFVLELLKQLYRRGALKDALHIMNDFQSEKYLMPDEIQSRRCTLTQAYLSLLKVLSDRGDFESLQVLHDYFFDYGDFHLALNDSIYREIMTSLLSFCKRQDNIEKQNFFLDLGVNFYLNALHNGKLRLTYDNHVVSMEFFARNGDIHNFFKCLKLMEDHGHGDMIWANRSHWYNKAVKTYIAHARYKQRQNDTKLTLSYDDNFGNDGENSMAHTRRGELSLLGGSELISYKENLPLSNGISLKKENYTYSLEQFVDRLEECFLSKERKEAQSSLYRKLIRNLIVLSCNEEKSAMLHNCKRLLQMEEDKLVSLIPSDFSDEDSIRLFFSERSKTIEACGYMVKNLCKAKHIHAMDIRDATRDIRNISLALMEKIDELMYKDQGAALHAAKNSNPNFLRQLNLNVYGNIERPQWYLNDANGEFSKNEDVVGSISGTKAKCIRAKYDITKLSFNYVPAGPNDPKTPFFIPYEIVTGKYSGTTATLSKRITQQLLDSMFPSGLCNLYARSDDVTWEDLVADMISFGYRKEDFRASTYNRLLTAYSDAGKVDSCMGILAEMQRLHRRRNRKSYSSLLLQACFSGNLNVWNEVKRRQLKDPHTTSNFVMHCNSQHTKSKSFKPNLRQLMSELRGYTYKGDMEEAIEVFAEMSESRNYLSKSVYLDMAYGYALNGDNESVNDVINEIIANGGQIDFETFFRPFCGYVEHESEKTRKFNSRHDRAKKFNAGLGIEKKYDTDVIQASDGETNSGDSEDEFHDEVSSTKTDSKITGTSTIFDADGTVIGAAIEERKPYEKPVFEKESISHIIEHIRLMDRHGVPKKLGYMQKIVKQSQLTKRSKRKIIAALYEYKNMIKRREAMEVGRDTGTLRRRYQNQTARTDFTYSEDGYIIDVARDVVDEADNTLQLI